MKKSVQFFALAMSALMITGCVTVDTYHALDKTTPNEQPLVPQDYVVEVEMNERIARQVTAAGIEKLVYQSLQTALQKANIFTPNGKGYYKVRAKIVQASQAPFDLFGKFRGKMEIEYTVTNQDSDPVFVKKIYNEGESDQNSIFMAVRHTRSRVVTVADNVNQFVQEFNDMMKANEKANKKMPEENN